MRQNTTFITAGIAVAVVLSACGRRAQPEAPAPQQTPTPVTETRPTPPPPPADDGSAARLEFINTMRQMIFFDYDRSDIREDARQVLDAKVPLLRSDPSTTLRIEGHADERGSVEYNLALGMRRANAARQYLVGFGLDAARFETVSFGEERPLAPGQNEQAWARNRRAEFHITGGQFAGGR